MPRRAKTCAGTGIQKKMENGSIGTMRSFHTGTATRRRSFLPSCDSTHQRRSTVPSTQPAAVTAAAISTSRASNSESCFTQAWGWWFLAGQGDRASLELMTRKESAPTPSSTAYSMSLSRQTPDCDVRAPACLGCALCARLLMHTARAFLRTRPRQLRARFGTPCCWRAFRPRAARARLWTLMRASRQRGADARASSRRRAHPLLPPAS